MAQKLSYAEQARKGHNWPSPATSTSSPSTANIVNDSEAPAPTESATSAKPALNVWNVRREKMAAAARAAQKSTPTAPPDAASLPSTTSTSNNSDNRPPDGQLKKVSPVLVLDVGREDPFIVKMPQHLPHAHPVSTEVKSKGQHSQQDTWPEVGKAISVSASSSSKSMGGSSNPTDDSPMSMHGNGVNSSPNSLRKNEKPKWVSIPKRELQEAADAAAVSVAKHRPHARKAPRQPPNNSVALSLSTSTNSSLGNTSNPSPNTQPQSRIPSANTSASESRSESVQSSPNLSRGIVKKILPDTNPQESTDALACSGNGHKKGTFQAMAVPPANVDLPVEMKLDSGSGDEMPRKLVTDPDGPDLPCAHRYIAQSASSYQPPSGSGSNTPAPSVQRLPPLQTSSASQFQQPDCTNAAPNKSSNQSGSSSPHVHQIQHLPPSTSASGHYVPSHPHVAHATPYSRPQYTQYNFNPSYGHSLASHSHHLHYAPQDLALSTTAQVYGEATKSMAIPLGTAEASYVSPPISAANDGPPPPLREKMVFGSIDVTSSESDAEVSEVTPVASNEKEDEKERKKPFAIAIGVDNGADIPARVRAVQKKSVGNGKTMGGPLGEKEKDRKESKKDEKDRKKTKDDEERRVGTATLTGSKSAPEIKWKFGTTSMSPPPTGTCVPTDLLTPQNAQSSPPSFISMPSIACPPSPFILEPNSSSPATPPANSHPTTTLAHHDQSQTYHPSYDLPSSTVSGNAPSPHALPLHIPVSTVSSSADPDLAVKDFGYGFGAASGSGYAPILAKERQREWEAERERERVAAATAEAAGWQDALSGGTSSEDATPRAINPVKGDAERDLSMNDQLSQRDPMQPREPYQGRGRRPTFSNSRGGYGGGDRGPRRRGTNGFSRGYRGYNPSHQTHNRGGLVASPISPTNSRGPGGHSSPFSVTPPPHFQALPIDSSNSGGPLVAPPPLATPYYHPHLSHTAGRQYLPPGYEAYATNPVIPAVSHVPFHQIQRHLTVDGQTHKPGQMQPPPLPVPMTTISFPLDPTRYYLLGQLEYYLSPQNMAQDLYLRRQMDARGWIPISLIAPFNRVRQLTQDVYLVRDVLTLSSLVQVRGNMVRMGGWEQFVLPDAAPSTVEEQPLPSPYQNLTNYYYPDNGSGNDGTGGEGFAYPGFYPHPGGQDAERVGIYGAGTGEVGSGEGGAMTSTVLVNGHRHDPDDEDDDEVEIVMGQEVGMFMPDRPTS